MNSPQVVRQLKNYQRLCRKQFLLRSQGARHAEWKSSRTVQRHCSESGGRASVQKLTDASYSHSAAFRVDSTTTDIAQPVINPVTVTATNTSATDTVYCCANGMWSKSKDSAFLSFISISNSQNK